MKQAIVILIGVLVIAVAIYNRWRILRRARVALEAMAATLGIKRRATETDEELRARCRALLHGVPTFNRDSVRLMVEDALWEHGYRRAVVVLSEPDFGHIRARVCEKVPAGVLRTIESELRDRVPLTMHLELAAEP